MSSLPERARLALREAMRARDAVATSALRTLLSTLANAEAVVPAEPRPGAIEAAPVGAGSTDVSRRTLSPLEVTGLALAEIAEREDAATLADTHRQHDRATRLRREAGVLRRLLED